MRRHLGTSIELIASIGTLAGMLIGSTTTAGAAAYLFGLLFWFVLMYRNQMWGLLPVNVCALVVTLHNLAT